MLLAFFSCFSPAHDLHLAAAFCSGTDSDKFSCARIGTLGARNLLLSPGTLSHRSTGVRGNDKARCDRFETVARRSRRSTRGMDLERWILALSDTILKVENG